ncbi:MAG: hypothetical protein NVS3B2_02700 [Ramlibacter sp.]
MNAKLLLALVVATAATVAVDANAKTPATVKAAVAAPRAPDVVAVDVPPPSGSWEPAVAPANGHIWSGGYYQWKDGHYAWKKGEWVLARAGMEYRQHRWVQRADGKYVLTGGDWISPQDKVAGKQ